MIVKRTHHFLHWAFGLFVAYLLITRIFISWIQFWPGQFISVVQWMTDTTINAESIDVDQDWLGFQVVINKLFIESLTFQLQADKLDADINTFSMFIPSIGYGDYLHVDKGSYQVKNPLVVLNEKDQRKLNEPLSEDEVLVVEADIGRLWKRVHFKDFVLSEVIRPGLSVQLHDFQSINASMLSVVSQFSLSYKDVLNYERFSLKSSFSPNVWGGLDSGEFSITSFKPLRIERLSKLLSVNWQQVLPQGELILDLAGTVSQSTLSNLVVNLNSQSLKWRQNLETLPNNVGLQLSWQAGRKNIQRQFKDWNFSLSKIQIDNRYVKTISPVELYFGDDQMLNFNANYFDIEPFKVIVKSLIKSRQIADLFDRTAYLSLSNLNGKLNWQTLNVAELSLYFDKLDIPVTDYPGMSLQNLQVIKTPQNMSLSTSKPIWIMSPIIHEKPMRLDLPKDVILSFDELNQEWSLPQIKLSLNKMPISLSVNKLSSSYLDTEFKVKIQTMEKLKRYLPYSLMSKNLQAWLKKGLQGGENIIVKGKVKGRLSDFPFESGEGVFGLDAIVKNAKLNFNSKWPMLTNFNAKLKFIPYQLQILVDEVDVQPKVKAKKVSVVIDDLNESDIGLTVNGYVDSTLDVIAKYLVDSPIAEKLGMKRFFDQSEKFSGKAIVVLDKVWVPISGYETKSETVNGSVQFKGAKIQFLESFELDEIKGRLDFTESKVDSNRLTFKTLKGVGSAKVVTDRKTQKVSVIANGNAIDETNDWFSSPVPWKAKVLIPFKTSKSDGILIHSTVEIDKAGSRLPSPLSQNDLKSRNLSIKAKISDRSISVNSVIPKLISSELLWGKDKKDYKFISNVIQLGHSVKNSINTREGSTLIVGEVDSLDIDGWIPVFKSFDIKGMKGSVESDFVWGQSSLRINNVKYLSRPYKNIKLDWQSKHKFPLSLDIKSSDIDGAVEFTSNGSIQVIVNYLNFYTDESVVASSKTDTSEEDKECQSLGRDKGLLPEVSFSGKNIYIDGRAIETLRFRIVDTEKKLYIKDMNGLFGNGAGILEGNYWLDKEYKTSNIQAALTSKNVTAVTEFLKLNKGFSGKSAIVRLDLNWKGGLECFSTNKSKGAISFEIKEGAVEDIEPGFARLIGLLSVESLIRRLKLDLKDVTNKGMTYDEISGNATLRSGILELERLDIKAPSANGSIQGKVDVGNKAFDLVADITPKVGATLPTLAAIAGAANPLTALAVYTLMKVIPGVNENLITYSYEITGPWNSPIIDGDKTDDEKMEVKEESILDIN